MGRERINMVYTNSGLVSYTRLSPNNSGERNHAIDTITIHCVVGQLSVETIGNIFAPASRQASCNYGIGLDGRIGLYCEEKNRSWCTSSASNDHRAITIEVASDTSEPYAVREVVYKSLINLLVDICQRNGIKKLLWKADNSLIGQVDKQNMTVHRWFANKSCPGEWLYSRHGQIADDVNARLGLTEVIETSDIKAGDTVKLKSSAIQWDGKNIRNDYKAKEYKVQSVNSEGRAVLTINDKVIYAVSVQYLDKAGEVVKQEPTVPTFKEFKVKVTTAVLNVRKAPVVRADNITGQIRDYGVYTIVEVDSTGKWGKLKSGMGWIHLDYANRV